MPERRTATKLIRFRPEELAPLTERARAVRANVRRLWTVGPDR